MITYQRAVVSSQFRENLRELVPQLDSKEEFWRFASYLLFPSSVDPNGRAAMPQELIHELLGRKRGQSAIDRVEEFSKAIWPVKLSGWRWGWATMPDECRHVEEQNWPVGLAYALRAERLNRSGKLVYLDDGTSYSAKSVKLERDFLLSKSLEIQHELGIESLSKRGSIEAWHTLNYLNNLAPNRFSKMLEHMDDAIKIASDHSDSQNQLNVLKLIGAQAKPYYKPVRKSSRLFAMNASLLRLAAPVRKELTKTWIHADLASCQLAIISTQWGSGIPSLIDYLECRRKNNSYPSLWRDLCEHIGLSYSDDHKAICKELLYAIVFGMGIKRLKNHIKMLIPGVTYAIERFLSHPLILDILEARKLEFDRIIEQGFGIDAFQRKIYPDLNNGKENWSSVLACVAQSYELALLFPVIELATERTDKRGFTILSWLHDGFSFVPNSEVDSEQWKTKIQRMVNENAQSLGIPTWIEFS